jgi:hypothetical protein
MSPSQRYLFILAPTHGEGIRMNPYFIAVYAQSAPDRPLTVLTPPFASVRMRALVHRVLAEFWPSAE